MKRSLVCVSLALAAVGLVLAQGPAAPQPSDSNRVEIRIHIEAPPDTVWRALTNPRLVKQWLLGVDTETDWRVGSPLVQRGMSKNKPHESKGRVLESERPKRLAHTHWSATSGLPDRPEHYQTVRYELTPSGEGTELTVIEENISDQEKRNVSEANWRKVLRGLKAIAERRRSSE